MQYWIYLKINGKTIYCRDSFLDFNPRALSLSRADVADDLGICKDCPIDSRCHPIGWRGIKYCTVLFHDTIKPFWKIEDVL